MGRSFTSPEESARAPYLGEPGVLVDVLSFVDRGLQLLQDASAARQRSRQSRKLPPSCKPEEQSLCAAESIPGQWSAFQSAAECEKCN